MRATNEKMDEAIERLQKIADDENAPAEERGRAKRALRVLVVENDDEKGDDDEKKGDDRAARAARGVKSFSALAGGSDPVGQAIAEMRAKYYGGRR